MKANVSIYNDFNGTAAADIEDINLNYVLETRNIDINKYEPIGVRIIIGENNCFTALIICLDINKSENGKKHAVEFYLKKELSHNDLIGLFKKFEVVLYNDYETYREIDVEETITI